MRRLWALIMDEDVVNCEYAWGDYEPWVQMRRLWTLIMDQGEETMNPDYGCSHFEPWLQMRRLWTLISDEEIMNPDYGWGDYKSWMQMRTLWTLIMDVVVSHIKSDIFYIRWSVITVKLPPKLLCPEGQAGHIIAAIREYNCHEGVYLVCNDV